MGISISSNRLLPNKIMTIPYHSNGLSYEPNEALGSFGLQNGYSIRKINSYS